MLSPTELVLFLAKPPCCLSAGPDAGSESLIAGLQGATIIMLVMPFLLVGGAAVWILRWQRDDLAALGGPASAAAAESPGTAPDKH